MPFIEALTGRWVRTTAIDMVYESGGEVILKGPCLRVVTDGSVAEVVDEIERRESPGLTYDRPHRRSPD